jgi:phosphate/phosphite/phosphonate ABC transporter binding protein
MAPPVPRALLFGFTPAHGAAEAAAWGSRLAAYLTVRLGMPTRPFVASSYGTLVERMTEGRVDIGWLPPLVYVAAAKRGGAEPVVKFVRHGRSNYHSAFIVRSASPLQALRDLAGKRMAWTDPRSSAGYLFPRAFLLRSGMDPDHLFSHQAFLGNHRRVVEAVLDGRADVGVTYYSPGTPGRVVADAWHQYFPKRTREIRILALAGPIPSDTISVRRNLSLDVTEKVREAFVRMNEDPAGRELLLRVFSADRALPARRSEYAGVEHEVEVLKHR